MLFPGIIANNFASIYHVLTKLGTKMCHYTTFLCIKFQGNQITCFHCMVTLTPLRKEEKRKRKNEETKLVFGSSYLRNAWHNLFEFWNVEYWRWRASPQQKIVQFCRNSTKLYIRENHIIVFPVNILTDVVHWLLGLHNTLLCVLILEMPGAILECGVLTVKGICTAKIIWFRRSSTNPFL